MAEKENKIAEVKPEMSEKKKFKAKMSYADKLGVPFVALVGEDEISEGVLSV